MKQLLITGTVLLLLGMMTGTIVAQDNLLQAFASCELLLQGVRALLIGLLLGLFFTSPPRSVYFRAILGTASLLLFIGVPVLVMDNYIRLLDALVFIETAIIFAVNAIESPQLSKTTVRVSKKATTTTS